jgi:hypothetical protein
VDVTRTDSISSNSDEATYIKSVPAKRKKKEEIDCVFGNCKVK